MNLTLNKLNEKKYLELFDPITNLLNSANNFILFQNSNYLKILDDITKEYLNKKWIYFKKKGIKEYFYQ